MFGSQMTHPRGGSETSALTVVVEHRSAVELGVAPPPAAAAAAAAAAVNTTAAGLAPCVPGKHRATARAEEAEVYPN